jgi:hypothetical protein
MMVQRVGEITYLKLVCFNPKTVVDYLRSKNIEKYIITAPVLTPTKLFWHELGMEFQHHAVKTENTCKTIIFSQMDSVKFDFSNKNDHYGISLTPPSPSPSP